MSLTPSGGAETDSQQPGGHFSGWSNYFTEVCCVFILLSIKSKNKKKNDSSAIFSAALAALHADLTFDFTARMD